ncbi:MAG: hypothetical protein KGJ60_06965 [Verrucomicrobiota bacterium]|nr:hypothetical protein [Verrucomicrobiota bacterium]
MKRWLGFLVCGIFGLGLLICGLLVPAHLRAVEGSVLQRAGGNTPSLVEQGLALVNDRRLGAAQSFQEAAQAEKLPGEEQLRQALTRSARQHPDWLVWGGDPDLERLFGPGPRQPEPLTDFMVEQTNRDLALQFLRDSSQPAVKELLQTRALTRTVLFPPSQSAAGQAFDTAVSVCGLLSAQGHLAAGLGGTNLLALVARANRGESSRPLEQMLMDLMSLGRRFNWDQLAAFVSRIPDPVVLRQLADQARNAGGQLPVLFSSVVLSGRPAAVANYLADFPKTGLRDLAASLQYGAGGLSQLLRSDCRLDQSRFWRLVTAYNPFGAFYYFAADYCYRLPAWALAAKWLFYLLSGFLLAAALHFVRPAVSSLERPLQVRGFHVAREVLFALGFLLVVLLLSEPFLAQERQKEEVPLRLHLPTAGAVIPAGFVRAHPSFMNNLILLTLLLFFVLQGLIYVACLVKLAEIRRQRVPPRMKLKLLENEEHLFDAGLYLGFVGTIVSLILVSLGVIKFSLMAAYSSTSFGIIFVCVFKIFHLRPARRRLLLEAEAESGRPETLEPGVAPTFATPS